MTLSTFSRLAPAVPTKVYQTYWSFATERQKIFLRRVRGESEPWTQDSILQQYKFTNAYRASDRVSQFLIGKVIYGGPQEPEDLFFRIILFKLFNSIRTWELLEREAGPITWSSYSFARYDEILWGALREGDRIYSAAYIMPPASVFGHQKKHQNHLALLELMMQDELYWQLKDARRMSEAFTLLRSYPSIGDFLGFQLVTDLNYSELTDFSEMEFVVPGPGARSGISKCFSSLGGLTEADLIQFVCDKQEQEFQRFGLEFETLWGRPLQLIDCQNLFCEVDKYSRVAHPDVEGLHNRSRIKQSYRKTGPVKRPWYPPKWGLNERIL